MITLLLFVQATYIWVLFSVHIPIMVNRTFNLTATERLQQLANGCRYLCYIAEVANMSIMTDQSIAESQLVDHA